MANYNPRLTVEWALRLCDVDGRPGYFHTWEYKPNGVLGIVEFSDGVERVQPDHIKFCDEQNYELRQWEEYKKSHPDIHA